MRSKMKKIDKVVFKLDVEELADDEEDINERNKLCIKRK